MTGTARGRSGRRPSRRTGGCAAAPRDRRTRQHESALNHRATARGHVDLDAAVELVAAGSGFARAYVDVVDGRHLRDAAVTGAERGTLARERTSCATVVDTDRPLVVPDARVSPRWAAMGRDLAATTYVGVPLHGREGLPVGTPCVIDPERRDGAGAVVPPLLRLARMVEDQLELLRRRRSPGAVPVGELADALDRGEIVPRYQPVVDLSTGRTTGHEALARRQHPDRGLLMPESSISVAEDTDMIHDLGEAVLTRALADPVRWRDVDGELTVAVDASGRELQRPGYRDRRSALLAAAGVRPDRLVLELTETSASEAVGDAARQVAALGAAGVRLALDDSGTGRSSLEHVLALPVAELEIDRSATRAPGTAAVRSVTRLARDLSMSAVIEGVETAGQAAAATRSGCVHGQGCSWGPPRPASDVVIAPPR